MKQKKNPVLYSIIFPLLAANTIINIFSFFRSVRSTKTKESSRSMIFPGTNWCGKGWKVSGYSNLGAYSGADKCCRQHDLGCPYSIAAGETKYGLYNFKFYTISHCTCDERWDFYVFLFQFSKKQGSNDSNEMFKKINSIRVTNASKFALFLEYENPYKNDIMFTLCKYMALILCHPHLALNFSIKTA